MTSQRGSGPGNTDPMRAGSQLFEAGYQSLFDGWRQAQEFWNGVARSWGGASGAWLGQNNQPMTQSMDVLRELNEAALAVAQAWMRLPLVLMGGAQPNELQEATTRLTQAQGRAYQLWLEALSRTGQTAASAATEAARESGQAARQVERETRR